MTLTYELYRAPESELIRLREYHESCVRDAQNKLKDIDNVLQSRKAQKRYRQRLDNYGRQYIAEAGKSPSEALIWQIIRDLSCSRSYAEEIAAIARKNLEKERRRNRDARVQIMAELKIPVTDIAEREDLSRQQIYNILKK